MLCTIKRRDVTLEITLAIRAPVTTKTNFIECISKYSHTVWTDKNVLVATAYFAAIIVLFLARRGSVKKVSCIVRFVNPCVGVARKYITRSSWMIREADCVGGALSWLPHMIGDQLLGNVPGSFTTRERFAYRLCAQDNRHNMRAKAHESRMIPGFTWSAR